MKKFFTEIVTLEGILSDIPVTLDVNEADYLSFAQAVDVLLPDNTEIVTNPDGTLTYIIDGVEVPLSVLEGEVIELNPEVGPEDVSSVTLSGGGSAQPFDLGSIGPSIDLTDLLPPTALAFGEFTDEEIIPFIDDDENSLPEVEAVFDIPLDPVSGAPSIDASEAAVSENALTGGTDMGSGASETSGMIDISTGDDALGSVVINGIDVTNGGTVEGEFGVLTVTVDADGNFSYNFVLDGPAIHPDTSGFGTNEGLTDNFDIVVSDVDGDQAFDDLVIGILDDGPTANDDAAAVAEDGDLSASGNVVTENDVMGADGASVSAVSFGGEAQMVGTAFETAFGAITLNADGSYSYALDNTNADVQGLADGETLTEEFTYTLTDADGDSDTAVLTITINGADDGVVIEGLEGGADAPEITVDEANLADGSDSDAAALTQTGEFSVEAPDGLADVSLEGIALVEDGVLLDGPLTVDTALGLVTITGFTPEASDDGTVIGGEFTFSYVLEDNGDNALAADDASLSESLTLTVTDTDGSPATDTLDIEILDDVPTANDDAFTQSPENAPVTGNLLDDNGAGIDLFGADGRGDVAVALVEDGTFLGAGELTVNANGTFTYVPAAGEEGEFTFTYIITDEDGDTSTAIATITLTDDSTPVAGVAVAAVDDDGLSGGNADDPMSDLDANIGDCLLYTSPSPRDRQKSRMPSSA